MARLRSEIGLDDRGILDDLLRRSLRDLRAFLHHDDMPRLRQVPRLVASIEGGHGNVLPAGHREEGPGDLVGLRDPGRHDPMGRQTVDPPAVQGDFSLRWFRESRDQVQESRFPGSVRPDQPKDVPLLQRQGDAADGAHAAEGLVDVRDGERSLHSISPRSSGTYFRRVPTIPSGRKRAITMTRRPMMTNSKPMSTVRKYWDDRYTAKAPKRGPRSVPSPPITIIASMINEKVRENASFGKIPDPCQ